MSAGLDLDQARRAARDLGGARVPRHVPVALERALGRVLAVEVRAAAAVPATDVAAVDGWAVAGPGPWHVGPSASARGGLPAGHAVAVDVGAVLPRGTEHVLAVRDGLADQGTVHARRVEGGGSGPGRTGVRARGEEMAAGEVVLGRGRVLTAPALGLAAAAGADSVHVVLAPRTVLLVTGDELVDTGTGGPGRTRDSAGHVLAPLLHGLGAELDRVARTGDDPATLEDVFAGPYRSTVDLVVTTGGTGAGADDRTRAALAAVGARLVVDGPAVDPGGTALLATVPDGPVVLALPGDPLAAVAALLVLGAPLLDGWLGRREDPLPGVGWAATADTGHDLRSRSAVGAVPAGPGPTRLVPATIEPGRAGAHPTGHDGPGMLRGLAAADGFAVLAPDGAARWLALPSD